MNTSKELIKKIKEKGGEVKISHLRVATIAVKLPDGIIPKGFNGPNSIIAFGAVPKKLAKEIGATIAPIGGGTRVTIFRGATKFEGVAECSLSDNFNYKYGVLKALHRAIGKARKAGIEIL